MLYDVIVVGMGAAGMFALANIPPNIRALGLEGTAACGKKLSLTGGGRCNLTNLDDMKILHGSYNNPSFVRPILSAFSNHKTIEWFEAAGLSLISEDGKVYPKSQDAASVVNTLLNAIKKNKHKILLNTKVKKIALVDGDLVKLSAHNGDFLAKEVIVATGGASFPKTGSDGEFLRDNFEIVPFEAGLVPLFVNGFDFNSLQGVRCHAGIKLLNVNNKSEDEERKRADKRKKVNGDVLFGKNFLTGPAILNLSNFVKSGDKIEVDFLPDINVESLRNSVHAFCAYNPKKLFKQFISEYSLIPKSLFNVLVGRCGLNEKRAADISKKDVSSFITTLKNFHFTVLSKAPIEGAYVSLGGIPCSMIDSKNMSLKDTPQIKIIGEAADIAGDTGGYNLQYAFSSAMKALDFNKRKDL